MFRIGVDVGGTNTDAVLMRGSTLVGSFKTPTTKEVESGVVKAISALLRTHDVSPHVIECVMIGTTQFVNAFVERRNLSPIGVIRIASPATTSIPPLYDWPHALLSAVGCNVTIVGGGYEFDGRELAPLDEMAVAHSARMFRKNGLKSVAISCAFAPVNATMERRAADIVRSEMPDVHISLSSTFGRMGLIERENAAAMNASMSMLARTVVRSFDRALNNVGIRAPLYISQNDGTLMSASEAEQRPVMTFASGPTNSMRGAAYLSGLDEAIVLDIGGTTSDVGFLTNSFPRESAVADDIGGVRTNFRMPDLISIGLGGGSLVQVDSDIHVGPQSVGYQLTEKALVFGGQTLTTTDIMVAAGTVDIGDKSRVAHLSSETVERSLDEIQRLVEDAIDRIKTSRQAVPLVLVGGGSILITRNLNGASDVRVPEHFSVANAVGAAMAQVGGEVDSYFSYETDGRDAVLETAKKAAIAEAVHAGAASQSVRIVEIEEIPLGYLPGNTVRVRIKAVGDLELKADNHA